jgi:class 3 adenylate cyclase
MCTTLLVRLPFVWAIGLILGIQGISLFLATRIHGADPTTWGVLLIILSGIAATLAFASFTLERYHRADFLSRRLLETERAKSEALLLNILPGPVAERLKLRPDAIADDHACITILFADIVDFTPLATRMTAHEVVQLLNRIFSRFDALADRHGLEKIKTIGDAYMAAAGLPVPDPRHAERVAAMALDMQAAIAAVHAGEEPLRLRIGIHSGPAVAGVIGTKRFLYDLWGDTVNLASRMESHGSPGTIQVTESTRQHLVATHRFSDPRQIEVKGKGSMTTYLLIGPK